MSTASNCNWQVGGASCKRQIANGNNGLTADSKLTAKWSLAWRHTQQQAPQERN